MRSPARRVAQSRSPAARAGNALEPVSIAGSPALALGAGVAFDCEIWSADFRERLPEGSELRNGFSGSPKGGTRASVKRLGQLHDVALRVTQIDR